MENVEDENFKSFIIEDMMDEFYLEVNEGISFEGRRTSYCACSMGK